MEEKKDNFNKVSKQGYKLTKLGWIPDDWKVLPLENIGEFSKGRGISKSEIKSEGYPCLTYGEIYTKHHDYIRSFNSFINEESSKLSKAIFGGEILFAGSGETLDEIGKCAAYLNKEKAFAGGDIIIFKPSHSDSLYLSYLLNSNFILRYRRKLGQGHSVVHIYSSGLKSLEIPVPPLPEQQKIAQILSTWDKAIETTEQLIRAKTRLKKGLMQQLLTGKKRFKEFEREEWKEIHLGKLCKGIRGVSYTPSTDLLDYENDNTVRLLRSNNINTHGISLESIQIVPEAIVKEPQLLKNGDIIVCMSSGSKAHVGKSARFNLNDNQYCMGAFCSSFRCNNIQDQYFVSQLFKSELYQKQLHVLFEGTNINNLKNQDIEDMKFRIPANIDERIKISSVLMKHDKEIEIDVHLRNLLKRQKKGLMQKLLTGEVRVKTKNKVL